MITLISPRPWAARSVLALLALGIAAGSPAGGQAGSDDSSSATVATSETQPAAAQDATASIPELTPESLNDPESIAIGKEIWEAQCRHCHGRAAYPGKAPKLKPRKYTPEFVYDRVTNGFRKMPPWKDVFSDEQRRAVVAYVLSGEFSP